jgi:hypothetical protein
MPSKYDHSAGKAAGKVFDVWGDDIKEVKASAGIEVQRKRGIKRVRPSERQAAGVLPGQSYNPPEEAHTEAMEMAADQLTRQMTHVAGVIKFLKKPNLKHVRGDMFGPTWENDEEPETIVVKMPQRKTPYERNKADRRREQKKHETHQQMRKQLTAQLFRVDEIVKEHQQHLVERDEKEKKRLKKAEWQPYRVRRLGGRHHFHAIPVLLPEEIPDNLRSLPKSDSLQHPLKDRFANIQQRNMITSSVPKPGHDLKYTRKLRRVEVDHVRGAVNGED